MAVPFKVVRKPRSTIALQRAKSRSCPKDLVVLPIPFLRIVWGRIYCSFRLDCGPSRLGLKEELKSLESGMRQGSSFLVVEARDFPFRLCFELATFRGSGDLRPSASTASTSTSPTLISLVFFAPGEYSITVNSYISAREACDSYTINYSVYQKETSTRSF